MSNMTEEDARLLEKLRSANPAAVALAEALALKGSTLDAISSSASLGIKPINRILAQELPEDVAQRVMQSPLGQQVSPGTPLTYGYIRGLIHGKRETRLVQVADGTTRLREALLSRAVHMVEQGAVVSWRDLMGGLRVLGVPSAGSITDVDKQHAVRPAQYMLNDEGKMVENPAYVQWITKKDNTQLQQVNLHIGLDLLAQGGTAPLGNKPLVTDSDGNVTALRVDGEQHSLVSMEADQLHQMAYGKGSQLKPMKPRPALSMEDLI